MPKKVKVVNVNDDTTYADITEAVIETRISNTNQLKKLKRKK